MVRERGTHMVCRMWNRSTYSRRMPIHQTVGSSPSSRRTPNIHRSRKRTTKMPRLYGAVGKRVGGIRGKKREDTILGRSIPEAHKKISGTN